MSELTWKPICLAVPKYLGIVARPKRRLNSPRIHGVAMSSALYLVQFSEGRVITQFPLRNGTNRIGRSSESHVILPDWSVSRRHAEIRVARAKVTVFDLKSRNGTFVGDRRVQTWAVDPGEEIRFGEFRLVLLPEEQLPPGDSSVRDTHDPRHPQQPALEAPKLPVDLLTPAQRPVLKLLLEGHLEREIAEILGLSEHTIHNHVKAIYKTYSVHKKVDLLRHLLPRVDQTVILRHEDVTDP